MVGIICPLLEIGLTDLPKREGEGACPPPPSSSYSPVTNDAGEGYSGQVFDKAPSNSPIPQSDDFKSELVFLFVCTCTFSTDI